MNPQGAVFAMNDDLDAPVDAYVDALMGVPVAIDAPVVPVMAPVDVVATAGPQHAAPVANAPAAAAAHPGIASDPPPRFEQATLREIAPPAIPVGGARDEVPRAGSVPSGQRWLRVAIGEDRYAVELLRVQEVVRVQPVIAMRGAMSSLLGVMNLRGRVVPVHDMGKWLRCDQVAPDERARIVVLEHQDELVGLLVAAVTDVVTLDAAQVEPPTPGTRDRSGLGIARTPGAPPTVLLDARTVFE